MKNYLVPALLSIAFVILLMSLSPNIPLQNQLVTPTLTAVVPTKAVETQWQTYRNDKYGFDFQYPSSWSQVDPEGDEFSVGDSQNNCSFSFDTTNKLKVTLPIQSWVNKQIKTNQERIGGPGYYVGTDNSNTTIIDGIKPVIYSTGNEGSDNTSYLFTKNNKIFSLSSYLYMGDSFEQCNQQITQILSTFKFLPDTSTWKTYKHTQYGFEFKYPTNWDILDKLNDSENKYVVAGSTESIQNERKYGVKDRGSNYFPLTISYSSIKPKYLSSGEEEVVSSEILFNDKDATKYVRKVLINNPSGGNEGEILTSIVVSLSQGYLNIYQSNNHQSPGMFTQILSTFKFTQPYFCGGIAGVACPTGYKCILDGQYPDAGGKCSKIEPSTTKYVCPADEWVSCMPPLGINKSQCQPEYLKWAKDYCPNFKGAAL